MIVRLTQKLARKVKLQPAESLPPSGDPLADWSANLFTLQRYQYILFTNTPSLYSAVIRGVGISDGESLIASGLQAVRAQMLFDSLPVELFVAYILPLSQRAVYSKSASRTVVGSMNDGIHLAKAGLIDPSTTLLGAGEAVNRAPMSMLGMERPKDAFLRLLMNAAGVGSR